MTPIQRARATRHSIRDYCRHKGIPLDGWRLREYSDQLEAVTIQIRALRAECPKPTRGSK